MIVGEYQAISDRIGGRCVTVTFGTTNKEYGAVDGWESGGKHGDPLEGSKKELLFYFKTLA